jgi:hypothetical protein
MRHSPLTNRFAEAGLKLELTSGPIAGSMNGDIVQIDIQRKVKTNIRSEYFRIWGGHQDNRIEVLGIDRQLCQLILMVHEPTRVFTVEIRKSRINTKQPEGKLLRETKTHWIFEQKTSNRKRHFLCGVDERQLFLCQLLKACSTVRDAHASLKSPTVVTAEGRHQRTTRQGEWFFLMPTDEELAAIEESIKTNKLKVERKCPIGPMTAGPPRGNKVRQGAGNPHTADELVVLPGTPLKHGWAVRAREVFVRGKVRHVDHATVSFGTWRKVIRNAEANEGRMDGVSWID